MGAAANDKCLGCIHCSVNDHSPSYLLHNSSHRMPVGIGGLQVWPISLTDSSEGLSILLIDNPAYTRSLTKVSSVFGLQFAKQGALRGAQTSASKGIHNLEVSHLSLRNLRSQMALSHSFSTSVPVLKSCSISELYSRPLSIVICSNIQGCQLLCASHFGLHSVLGETEGHC